MDNQFKNFKVNVPNKSGFDKSFQNLLTAKVGTLVPLLVDEVIPGQTTNIRQAIKASLPPLASDTFMRCNLKIESFFVPMRLLFGSFESWFLDIDEPVSCSDGTFDSQRGLPPVASISGTTLDSYFGVGSLADYLGYRTVEHQANSLAIPLMPFLAYGKIYDDWYRNSKVQVPLFARPDYLNSDFTTGQVLPVSSLPFSFTSGASSYIIDEDVFPDGVKYADGIPFYTLRQRNFGLDYFTTATQQPQQGVAQSVRVDVSGSTGTFTIASLRSMNSIQQFKERNNIANSRLVDAVMARYGADLSDGIAQRALLLGSAEVPVYSNGIYQNSSNASASTQNPFNSVASQYGSASADGSFTIIDNFTSNEPGYIFVIGSLVPKVTYSSGIRRYLSHYNGSGCLSDMANPILQNSGMMPIYSKELNGDLEDVTIFGYTDMYAEFMTREDELHGFVRDGQSLDAFALQRSFVGEDSPQITSAFLKIPTTYMDQVTAVVSDLSTYGYWLDTYFDYKVSMPLNKYSLPTLQDPAYEHGHSVSVKRGGAKL